MRDMPLPPQRAAGDLSQRTFGALMAGLRGPEEPQMPMRKSRNLPPEVRTTIWRDVQETPLHYAVSVREIISQVRRLVPNCSATDEELSSLIGALATAAGR